MSTKSYPSDLSQAQWNILEALLPNKSSTGRPREHTLYDIVTAILYILYEGCRWRSLPKEYPPWQTVYYWFRLWRKDGTLEHIRQVLVNRVREQSVRSAEASAGIIDTQTVKTAAYAHRDSGYDSAKKNQRTQTQYRYRYPRAPACGGHHLRFKHRKRLRVLGASPLAPVL